jgi:hypothetical protein
VSADRLAALRAALARHGVDSTEERARQWAQVLELLDGERASLATVLYESARAHRAPSPAGLALDLVRAWDHPEARS